MCLLFLFFDESVSLHGENAAVTTYALTGLFNKMSLMCLVQSMKFKEDLGNWAVGVRISPLPLLPNTFIFKCQY